MKYTDAKWQFPEFLERHYQKRLAAAADILLYNIEEIASYEKKSPFDITEKEALNGAENWFQYSENGEALIYTEDLRITYDLDAFDVNQYLTIQGELLEKVWEEWELFKYYREIEY